MAAVADVESALELANSIPLEEIPAKLRCASCTKLVVNAFKLPCCDQSLCQPCQSSLSEKCPICEHAPLAASDCIPHKNLRQTIRAFLKKEEKKREKSQSHANEATFVVNATPAPPAEYLQPTEQSRDDLRAQTIGGGAEGGAKDDGDATVREDHAEQAAAEVRVAESVGDLSQDGSDSSIEIITERHDETRHDAVAEAEDVPLQRGKSQEGATAGNDYNNMWDTQNGQMQNQTFGGGQMQDGSQAGFNGMGWDASAAFNPMMQMQQMQNAMNTGNWSALPNMMGMANMAGMDPMSMQQGMFGNGFGMGMNGMNGGMGMGFGNGGIGGNWDGQQMSADFGANAGYYPGGGYNQQSHQGQFPHQMHHHQQYPNKFQNNRFQGQGAYSQRGYGRGYHRNNQYGQGHWQGSGNAQNYSHDSSNQQWQGDGSAFQNQLPGSMQDSRPSQQDASIPNVEMDDHMREEIESENKPIDGNVAAVNAGSDQQHVETSKLEADEQTKNPESIKPETNQAADEQASNGEQGESFPNQPALGSVQKDSVPHNNKIATYESSPNEVMQGANNAYNNTFDNSDFGGSYEQYPGHDMNYGYGSRGRGFRRGFGRGGFGIRGGFSGRGADMSAQSGGAIPLTSTVPDVPINAPTGPKAWREGQSGSFGARGGFRNMGHSHGQSVTDLSEEKTERVAAPSERHQSRSPTRSPSRSRSRSHSRHKQRRHRHRSTSPAEEDEEDDRRRERKHHRSSRKNDDLDENVDAQDREEEETVERSRDASVASSRRRSNRRDKDKHRSSRAHRDRSREHRRKRHRSRSADERDANDEDTASQINETEEPGSESSRRKSRSERHREKDRERERKRDKERDRERDRSRDKDRKRSKRDRSASPTRDDYSDDEKDRRSSRRSRKDKDRERYREDDRDRKRDKSRDRRRDRDKLREEEQALPPPAAVDEVEFKIQGRSQGRDRNKPIPSGPAAMKPPPTGPRSQISINPPKGPAADRRRHSETASAPPIPATPASAVDPHTLEREARNRERMLREQQRRQSLQAGSSSSKLDRKRSYDDAAGLPAEKPFAPPTGPSAERNRKRQRGGELSNGTGFDEDGGKRGMNARRMSYKYEDEENDEARAARVETEREAARWR